MSHKKNATDFIKALGLHPKTQPKPTRNVIATIPASYSGTGRPPLLFDGEQTASTRLYPYLDSYTPAVGDRVLVAMLSNSGCILGKIT